MITKEFEEKGINQKMYDDFKISFKKPLNQYGSSELYDLFFNSVSKKIRKILDEATSVEEIQKLANEVSFGQIKIHITPLHCNHDDHKLNTHNFMMMELLKHIGKIDCDGNDAFFKHLMTNKYLGVVVEKHYLDFRWKQIKGYSLIKKKIGKKYSGRTWKLNRHSGVEFEYVFELSNLLAEAFVKNSIEKFTLKNRDWLQYAIAKEFSEQVYNGVLYLSDDPEYNSDLKMQFKKHKLLPEHIKIQARENHFRLYRKVFYLELIDGHIKDISSHELISLVVPEMMRQMEYIKDKTERKIQQSSDYAKAFQTKKHINKKTQEAMEHNAFLNKYGYVELDNDVDLERFNKLQEEFMEFCNHVYVPYAKDHSFRIKKLGKHRAAGLYYPEPIKATIFDLDYPSAYAHELGHQLDFTLSKEGTLLSEALRFRTVYDEYVAALENTVNSLPKGELFRDKWEGKTKYNKNYYLQNTEVFARSFELYLHHKGIESSFLKKSYTDHVYPNNEKYIQAVMNYFEELFSLFTIENQSNLIVEKADIRKQSKNKKVASEKNNKKESIIQLSLF